MQNTIQTKLNLWIELVRSGLIHPEQVVEYYKFLSLELFQVRANDPSQQAMLAFLQHVFVTAPLQEDWQAWDAISLANWGHTVYNFEEVIKTTGFASQIQTLITVISNHPVVLERSALCLLWSELGKVY